MLYIVILASISEELAFRGVVQRTIDLNIFLSAQIIGVKITLGLIVGAVTFSLVHLSLVSQKPKKLVALIMVSAFVLGLTAGYFYNITNSLIAPIIVHMEFNLVGLIAGLISSK